MYTPGKLFETLTHAMLLLALPLLLSSLFIGSSVLHSGLRNVLKAYSPPELNDFCVGRVLKGLDGVHRIEGHRSRGSPGRIGIWAWALQVTMLCTQTFQPVLPFFCRPYTYNDSNNYA